MIMDGDRLCLGLSGGKDSMTLLHVLLDLKKKAPIRCAHIFSANLREAANRQMSYNESIS